MSKDMDRAIAVAEREAELQREFRDEMIANGQRIAALEHAAKAETASLIAARLHSLKDNSK